jgi:DNA-binding CsgD family transcriptional regulator
VDDLDEARMIFRSLRVRADERAEESALPWILAELGLVEFLLGHWVDASRCADEATELALQTGQEPQRLFALGVRALVRTCRGETEGARADAEAVLEVAEQRGVMVATILASSALGLLELSLERPEATDRILGPLGERLEEGGVKEPGSVRFTPDEIEALIHLGRLKEAETLLDRLDRRARELDRASAQAGARRCRGLLAAAHGDLEGALAALEQALAEHERVPIPFERARTLLALGSARRRAKRRSAARESLGAALRIFEDLGARPWVEKGRAELARIGGRPPATGGLTPTETRVATLVSQGRSNKEVAAALFVSVKTVEANLSRIYAKLGLRSRAELAHELAARKPAEPASKL